MPVLQLSQDLHPQTAGFVAIPAAQSSVNIGFLAWGGRYWVRGRLWIVLSVIQHAALIFDQPLNIGVIRELPLGHGRWLQLQPQHLASTLSMASSALCPAS